MHEVVYFYTLELNRRSMGVSGVINSVWYYFVVMITRSDRIQGPVV